MRDQLPGLSILPGRFSICRLTPGAELPSWASAGSFLSVTRTPTELSVVCDSAAVPSSVRAEHGWRALVVAGPLDFALVGIVAGIAGRLAEAGVSIFVLSTYETDYVLVREEELERAVEALRAAGHLVA